MSRASDDVMALAVGGDSADDIASQPAVVAAGSSPVPDQLIAGALATLGEKVSKCQAIGPHASERSIYRLFLGDRTVVAVHSKDRAENDAFVGFTKFFHDHSRPVPKILGYAADQGFVFQEDLGDTTLLDWLHVRRAECSRSSASAALGSALQQSNCIRGVIEDKRVVKENVGQSSKSASDKRSTSVKESSSSNDLGDGPSDLNALSELAIDPLIERVYRRVIEELIAFQWLSKANFPFHLCTPRSKYDLRAVLWDLEAFKYLFLKTSGISVDEDLLADEFSELGQAISKDTVQGFMYRDFQARNIMVREQQNNNSDIGVNKVDGKPLDLELYFIDYQGGIFGPALYDLASLLYQGSAALELKLRSRLIVHFCSLVEKKTSVSAEKLEAQFPNFVLLFLLKVLGTYGLQGVTHRKPYFISAIPLAARNLLQLFESYPVLTVRFPYLSKVSEKVALRYIS